jgi:hypothetical protein
MMQKLTLVLFEFLLITFISHLSGANQTELWETSVAEIRKEFNYMLETYVKVYDFKIEYLEKQVSGNLINGQNFNFLFD